MHALLLSVLLTQTGAAPVLTLEEALERASVQNLDLVAARARLERARTSSRKAWAGYLPSLTVAGSYTRNSTEAEISIPARYHIRDVGQPTSPPGDPAQPPSFENPPGAPTSLVLAPAELVTATIQRRDQLGARAELRQALVAPTLWAAIHNAGRSEDLAALQYDALRRELLFGVARAWFAAVGMKETVAVQARLLEIQRAQEQQALVRYEAGAVPKIDLLRAQIDRARAEQDLVRVENALLAARSTLATLLGGEADFALPSREALADARPLEDPSAIAARALELRPEVQAAKLGVELAEGNRRGIWLSYLPALGLSAQYSVANVAGFTGDLDTWAVTLGVQWTLWDGGLREAQLREASAALAEAHAQARATALGVQDEVRRALLEVDSARANREKAARQVELANENLALLRTAYQAGAATSLDVSSATSALLAAELGRLNEVVSAQLAALGVLKAAGAFDVNTESRP